MVMMTAKRGVYMNQLKTSPFKASVLQFVPGLGPISCKKLMDYINDNDTITTRYAPRTLSISVANNSKISSTRSSTEMRLDS